MAKPVRTKNKDNARRAKKKVSLLLTERVEYVDWKDVNLLRRFMVNLFVSGPDALKLLSDTGINSFANFPLNTAKQFVPTA